MTPQSGINFNSASKKRIVGISGTKWTYRSYASTDGGREWANSAGLAGIRYAQSFIYRTLTSVDEPSC